MAALTSHSYSRFQAITKSDTANIPPIPGNSGDGITDAIYVGTKGSTGTIVAVMPNNDTVTFVGLLAGTVYPIRAKRINSTTTDASNLVALYF